MVDQMKSEQEPQNEMALFISNEISKVTQALVPVFHQEVNTLPIEVL